MIPRRCTVVIRGVVAPAAVMLLTVVGGPVARASSPAGWSGAAALTGGVTLSDATLASGPTGQTLLLSSAGGDRAVSPGDANTTDGTAATQAAFLPNGAAIINAGSDDLIYRSADGSTSGLAHVAGGILSFAANADELLVVTSAPNNAAGLGAASYSIGVNGSLTANGPVTMFFSGYTFGYSAVGLDPDGEADVVLLDYSDHYRDSDPAAIEVRRLNQGGSAVWQPSSVLGSDVAQATFAAAPGGRMVATWTDFLQDSLGYNEPHQFAAVREAGQGFGAVQTLLTRSVSSSNSAETKGVLTAAGPDGTLAVTGQTDDCPNTNGNTVPTSAINVWVSPPGSNGALEHSQVPGSTWSKTHGSSVTALAAGGGHALIGVHNTDITNDPAGDAVEESCGEPANSGEIDGTFTDDAVLTGGGDHVLGTGHFTSNAPTPGGGTTSSSNDVTLTAASLDANGYATVVGSLDTTNAVQFATYGAVGTQAGITPPTTTPPTSTPPTTNPPTTSTSTASTTTTAPATVTTTPLPQTDAKPLPQKAASVSTATSSTVTSAGQQSLTVTNTTSGVENLSIAEYAYASGVTTSAPHLTGAKTRALTRIAATTLKLQPHHKLTVHLKLSKTARKVLMSKRRLSVTLKLTSSEHGYTMKVTSKTFTLKAA